MKCAALGIWFLLELSLQVAFGEIATGLKGQEILGGLGALTICRGIACSSSAAARQRMWSLSHFQALFSENMMFDVKVI